MAPEDLALMSASAGAGAGGANDGRRCMLTSAQLARVVAEGFNSKEQRRDFLRENFALRSVAEARATGGSSPADVETFAVTDRFNLRSAVMLCLEEFDGAHPSEGAKELCAVLGC